MAEQETSSNKTFSYTFEGNDNHFTAAIKRMQSSISSLEKRMISFTSSFTKAGTAADSTGRKVQQSSKKVSTAANNVKTLNKQLSLTDTLLRSLTAISLGKMLSDAITNSVEFIEAMNLFRVAVDDADSAATRFINTMSEKFGLDPAELTRTYGEFYALSTAMGLADEQAKILSENFVKMGNDLASLWNTSVSRAWQALQSAMLSQSKPIRVYGVDVTEASLKQTALTLGIEESIDSMSRQNKLILTYITIMNQAKLSMGDFAKTIESPANQLRILQQQLKQLSRTFGDFFLGTISKALPILNGIVMALNAILRTFATLMGIKVGDFAAATDQAGTSVGDIADNASDAAKEMKKLVAPFDELNILSESISGNSGGSSMGVGVDPTLLNYMKEYDNLMESVAMKANKVRDYIMETLGFTKHINEETGEITWTWNFQDMLVGLQRAWGDLWSWWSNLSPGGKLASVLVAGFIGSTAWKLLTKIVSPIVSPWISAVGTIKNIMGSFADWMKGLNIGKTFVDAVPQVGSFGKAVSAMKGLTIPELALVVGSIALIGYALYDLFTDSEWFQGEWSNVCNQLGQDFSDMYNATLKPIFSGISKLLDDLNLDFKTISDSIIAIVKSLFNGLEIFIGQTVLAIMHGIEGAADFLAGLLTLDFPRMIRGAANVLTAFVNGFLATFNGILNPAVEALNWLIGKMNRIPYVNIPYIPYPNFQFDYADFTFAQGGFPETGQVFVAREAGPEMVGNLGGRTAVANNDQIVAGIAQGVYQAVTRALSDSGSGDSKTPVNVYLGNELVYKSYENSKRSRGVRIVQTAKSGLT